MSDENVAPSEHPRRLGRFRMTQDLLRNWRDLLPLFGTMVVVRADSDFASGTIEYTAFASFFEEVEIGCLPPEYESQATKEAGGKWTVKFARKPMHEPHEKEGMDPV